MTAEQLVRLYPPAWKARYGEEFVAMVGSGSLRTQQVIDIVSGAIDAWLSREARGGTVNARSFLCIQSKPRYSVRDGLIGGIVLVLAVATFALVEGLARRSGFALTAGTIHVVATPAAVTLSMPFWALKGQSRRVQLAVIGFTICFAVVISLV
jgi:hypothetical protein